MKKYLIPVLAAALILSLVFNIILIQKNSNLARSADKTDSLARTSCLLTLSRAVIAQDDIYDEVCRIAKSSAPLEEKQLSLSRFLDGVTLYNLRLAANTLSTSDSYSAYWAHPKIGDIFLDFYVLDQLIADRSDNLSEEDFLFLAKSMDALCPLLVTNAKDGICLYNLVWHGDTTDASSLLSNIEHQINLTIDYLNQLS